MEPTFYLSRDEVRELDRRAIEGFGVPGVVLMENAGRGCAELLMRLNPDRRPAAILCGPCNWVVDALFGNGLSKPLAAPYDWLAETVNTSGKPVLAIDLPSGLDCD